MLVIQILGLVGIAFISLFAAPQTAHFSPFLAVLLAWQWFMLPGFVLSLVLIKKLFWVERLPIAFVLSVGLGTPYTVLAILLRVRLEYYVGMSALVFVLILFTFLLCSIRQKSRDTQEACLESITNKISYGHVIYIIVLVIGIGAFAYTSSQWPPAGDDLAGLPFFSEVLRLGKITGTEPFHGTGTPVTPRNELIVWGYQNILVNKIAGTPPVDTLKNNRPIFIVLSFLAFFTFLRRFFKNDHLALFILSLWGIYLLATMQEDGMGSNLITRIVQDKFVGWFIVVPVILVLMLWVLESGQFRYLGALAIGALGATLLHPITLSTILILCSSFGIFHILFEFSKKALLRTILVGLVLALCLFIPIYQYTRYTSTMPLDLAGMRDAVEYGRMVMAIGRYRLWLLANGRYILHPSIVLQPVVLLGYALTPFLILQLRKSNAARLLVGATIFLPVFLYYPPLTRLVGKFVTPYLIWRLAWPIPALAILVIGWIAWSLVKWLANLFQRVNARVSLTIHYLLSFALVITVAYIIRPQIQAGYVDLLERRQAENFSTCSKAYDALVYLDQLTQVHPANVLASRSLNLCIPGYATLANVVEFRGYGTVNRLPAEKIQDSLQRVTDANYFSSTKQVDDLVMAMIERWDIDYVLIEAERIELNFQMKQMENLFSQVYSDRDFAIYAITKPIPHLPIIDGYTALRQRHWDEAERVFTQAIQDDPDQNVAYLGLGMVREAQGDPEQSLSAYLTADQYGADEPAILFQIANTYMLLRDTENAIQFYQQAAKLDPGRYSILSALGFAYHISDQNELARSSYEDAAALQAIRGSAMYYSILGDLMASTNWYSEAVVNYRRAIAIDPSSSLDTKLAQSLTKLGDWQGAIWADQQAITLDHWASTPHVHLGSIYQSQDRGEIAIQEFERAWRLNPTDVSAAPSLANSIQKESGDEEAIARMQDLLSLNRLLPAPHWGLFNIYSSSGDIEAEVKELNSILSIQVNDPSIMSTLGDLARESAEYEEAESYYDKALLLNPALSSARIGISYLYARATEYGPQIGQYLWLARAYPSAAWPHYLLASTYKNLGSLDTALAETQWAISLEPQNASGYMLLGDIYRSRGQNEQAIEQYQLAISFQPDLVDAYLNLSSAYAYLEQPDQARATLETALDQVQEIAQVRTALGDLSVSSRNFEAAKMQYEEAISLKKSFPDAYIGLSRLFLLMGDIEASLNTLQAATEKIPDDFIAYDTLADIELARGNPEAAMQWLQSGIQANPQASTGYVNLGDEYQRLGQLEKASESYQQALVVDDQDVSTYLKLATIYQNLNNYQTAEEIYRHLIEQVPYSNLGYLNLGNLYLKMGNLDNAETVYQEAISLSPLNPSLYLAMSNLYIIRGDWDTAIDTLKTGYQELPTSSDAALNLANIYRQIGDYENAQRVYEQALSVDPTVPGIYLGLAQLAQMQDETEMARHWLDQSLSSNPESMAACLNLANFYETQDEILEAEHYFQRALDLDPFDNANYIALAQFYNRQERFDEALQILQKALLIPPPNATLYINIGNTYLTMGQQPKAEQWYQAATPVDYMNISPYLSLSTLYQSQAKWDQALESLQNALQKQPGNAFVHMALGYLYKKMGGYERAVVEFQRTCALDPLRTDCRISLGDLYASTGRYAEAIDQYNTAIQLAPTGLSAYLALARTYTLAGQTSQATQIYSEAITHSPDQSTAWLARAVFFATQQNWEKALTDYKTAWQRFPDDQEAARQLAQFYRQRGDWEAARDVLETLKGLPTVEAATYIAIGNLYANCAQWKAAIEAYQQAIQQDKTVLDAYTGLANVYLLQDQSEEALHTYEAAVIAKPEDPQAYLSLGDAYLARLNYSSAQVAYEKAFALSTSFNASAFVKLDNLSIKIKGQGIDLSPLEEYARSAPAAGIYITVAYRHQIRGDWQTAMNWYQEAVALEPTNSAAWLSLGNYYSIRQDFQAALDALQMAVQYAPTSPSALLALGAVQEALELPDDALKTYNLAVEVDRSLISTHIAIAELYTSQEQSDQAIESLKKGLQVAPGDASGYEALGQLYLSLGQTDLAMETFRAGLEVIPGAASLYIGEAGFMGEQLAKAQEDIYLAQSLQHYAEGQIDKTIGSGYRRRDPDREAKLEEATALLASAQTKYNSALATYKSMVQDFETAESYYKQALRIQPDNVFALDGLGDLYSYYGLPDKALESYEQAVAKNPNYVMALNTLGHAYLERGRVDDARREYELAIKYSPNNLGTFYGILQSYGAMEELSMSSAAYSISYSQYWWVYFIEYYRESDALRLAQEAAQAAPPTGEEVQP